MTDDALSLTSAGGRWCSVVAGSVRAQGPLDPALLLKPPTERGPSYHGDYTGRHFSPLKQVDTTQREELSLAWFYRTTASAPTARSSAVRPSAHPVSGRGAAAGAPAHGSDHQGDSADGERRPLSLDAEPRLRGRRAHRQAALALRLAGTQRDRQPRRRAC